MRTSTALLLALATSIVFGNFCMMPQASAGEPDHAAMTDADHDMASMSHESDQGDGKGMPCDGGHCLAHALPAGASASMAPRDAVPVVPVAFEAVAATVVRETPLPVSASPPGQCTHVDTVVLRN